MEGKKNLSKCTRKKKVKKVTFRCKEVKKKWSKELEKNVGNLKKNLLLILNGVKKTKKLNFTTSPILYNYLHIFWYVSEIILQLYFTLFCSLKIGIIL